MPKGNVKRPRILIDELPNAPKDERFTAWLEGDEGFIGRGSSPGDALGDLLTKAGGAYQSALAAERAAKAHREKMSALHRRIDRATLRQTIRKERKPYTGPADPSQGTFGPERPTPGDCPQHQCDALDSVVYRVWTGRDGSSRDCECRCTSCSYAWWLGPDHRMADGGR